MIKAIALDDEPPALQVLQNFCNKTDEIILEKTFSRITEAFNYLKENQIDLLFLDINMPLLSGIDFYKKLENKPLLIFTTAYSAFALEGFELNAIDYLLKPFTYQRFLKAVEKANNQLIIQQQLKTAKQEYLLLKVDYSIVKVDIADILFIEGLDDYMKIHLVNKKPLVVRMTMKTMLEKLPSNLFLRVHRSYTISLKHIDFVRNKIINIKDVEIPISSSYEINFFSNFNKI